MSIMKFARRREDKALGLLARAAALTTFATLFFIIVYILVKGLPDLKPSLFEVNYNTTNVSLFPALITTLMTVVLALSIAVPLGVATAIYLVEYARRGSPHVRLVRVMTETLASIPSIVYGLFGAIFFTVWLGWGISLLAGSATLAIMILPLIIRTTEEGLKAVPDSYREGAFGLGAGRLRTVFRIVLPSAAPAILSGVILSVGRIVGETAALIYTAGTMAQIPTTPLRSGRTLAIHMYALSSESLYTGQAYATAVVLLAVVIGINALSSLVAKKLTTGNDNQVDKPKPSARRVVGSG